jgi:hypothetical protein
MKGQLQLRIIRRLMTSSWKFSDKYERVDRLVLYSIVNQETGKKYFKVYSLLQGYKPYIISRDELAFVKLLFMFYGPGDYYIQMWGKGKNRGMRNFWDGVISPERKFFRRRLAFSLNPTMRTKQTTSVHGDFAGKYMKMKSPGKWYSF